jgi:hypothetical protein
VPTVGLVEKAPFESCGSFFALRKGGRELEDSVLIDL